MNKQINDGELILATGVVVTQCSRLKRRRGKEKEKKERKKERKKTKMAAKQELTARGSPTFVCALKEQLNYRKMPFPDRPTDRQTDRLTVKG